MLDKFIVRGLLSAGLIVGLVGPANSHLAGTVNIGGSWVHLSSFICSLDIGGVPNPTKRPSLFSCTATVQKIDIICQNPQNKNVYQPGQAGIQTVLVVQDEIREGDIIDKKKGIAHKENLFPDDPLLNPEFCVNPNWIPVDVLVTDFTGKMEVFECTGPDSNPCSERVLTYTELHSCVIPPEFNISNPPPPGTPYSCVLNFKAHVK